MQIKKSFTISFAAFIAGLILLASLILLSTLVLALKKEGNATALDSAEIYFNEASSKTLAKIDVVLESLSTLTDTASLIFKTDHKAASEDRFLDDIASMKAVLTENDWMMSVYIGYGNGTFHQLIVTRQNAAILKKYDAPDQTDYIDRIITAQHPGNRRQKWRFLDSRLNMLSQRIDATVAYDPRARPWYNRALKSGHSIFTDPYIFSSSRLPGLTCARALPDGNGVLGVDITLTRLGDLLENQTLSAHGAIWILDGNNRLTAYSDLSWDSVVGEKLELPDAINAPQPFVRTVAQKMAGLAPEDLDKPFFIKTNKDVYMVKATGIKSTATGASVDLMVVMAAPLKDITGHINTLVLRLFVIASCLLALIIPLAVWLGHKVARPVEQLAHMAEQIRKFDFNTPLPPVSTFLKEIQGLFTTYKVMRSTIQDKTENLEQTRLKLGDLVRGGIALGEETELTKLVTSILETSRVLAEADGGVIYIWENEKLGVELLSLENESIVLGGLSGNPAPRVMVRPEILPFLDENTVLHATCECFNTKKIVIHPKGEFTLFPTGLPREPGNYAVNSIITVPIVTNHGGLCGVIQLFNADLNAPKKICNYVSALAAQAAVTLENRNLVNSLRELFDSLIQVIATSIDAKSPYTAGHCTRVPVICDMLARAVHETTNGPYADFRIETEEEWRQLSIAAWLHDCGKVSTPEFVVDKATKLETVYNRIHEIRTRFEVLRRDAEIDYYKKLIEGKTDPGTLGKSLEETIRELEDDFGFVARSNIGGEFMSEDAQRRLASIAQRTWKRHFSDRLGISNEEMGRKEDTPEPRLPVFEPLLADKAEHLFPRLKHYSHIKNAQGHPLKTPTYEYNKGELYNLCIARGTITAEERFKINEHTLSGLEMLSKIPFPENLDKVPEIAVSHHETLVGTGYPLQKNKDQLMIETRILTIADIFEALTASDRPYTNPKSVSQTLKIMEFMRDDKHIDPDLFDIFLKKKIFKKYADKYLDASQDDVFDYSVYLRKGNYHANASME